MKHHISLAIASLVVAGTLFAAETAEGVGDAKEAAAGGNDFAADLFGKLSRNGGNLFFSPHSVHVALAMTLAGARGDTAAEMAKVLHVKADSSRDFRALLASLNAAGKEEKARFRLEVANALWGQKGYPFEKPYVELVKEDFGGEMGVVDFRSATEEARKTINDWVEKRTERKIVDLIPQDILDAATRLVLTNAIYMKSAWDEPFKMETTREQPFHLAGGKTVQAPHMHRVGPYGYLKGDGFAAVEMPYQGHELTMVVLLPDEAARLPALEKKLPGQLSGWLSRLQHGRVDLTLPRFRIASDVPLTKVLQAMGMAKAFQPGADFSGIERRRELYVSDVLHKAYVDVNEEGTEAAAATAVVMKLSAGPREKEPVVFKADHPFLFLIRHVQTGAILFMGRLADPTAER